VIAGSHLFRQGARRNRNGATLVVHPIPFDFTQSQLLAKHQPNLVDITFDTLNRAEKAAPGPSDKKSDNHDDTENDELVRHPRKIEQRAKDLVTGQPWVSRV